MRNWNGRNGCLAKRLNSFGKCMFMLRINDINFMLHFEISLDAYDLNIACSTLTLDVLLLIICFSLSFR